MAPQVCRILPSTGVQFLELPHVSSAPPQESSALSEDLNGQGPSIDHPKITGPDRLELLFGTLLDGADQRQASLLATPGESPYLSGSM